MVIPLSPSTFSSIQSKNRKEVIQNETRKDIKYKKITEHSKKRRLRRMPDLLPVCMQDKLHGRKPEL